MAFQAAPFLRTLRRGHAWAVQYSGPRLLAAGLSLAGMITAILVASRAW